MAANKNRTSCALGFFDGLHSGHMAVIKAALEKDAVPAVFTFKSGPESTPLPKSGKTENLITEERKIKLLREAGIKVLYLPDFSAVEALSPEDFVEKVLVDELGARYAVCGFDFRFGRGGAGTAEDLKNLCRLSGIETEIVPPVKIGGETVSASKIRTLVKSGDIITANILLGYPLTYEGRVTEGWHLASRLGAPTINMDFPVTCVIPRFGVYGSSAVIAGKTYRGVTNIGVKPTVDRGKETGNVRPLIETHLIGFNGDLYGDTISVSLRYFVRAEVKFGNLDELKAQIEKDIDTVRQTDI